MFLFYWFLDTGSISIHTLPAYLVRGDRCGIVVLSEIRVARFFRFGCFFVFLNSKN